MAGRSKSTDRNGRSDAQPEDRDRHSLDELSELVIGSGVMGEERRDDIEQRARVRDILACFDGDVREDLVGRIASEDSINYIKIKRFCEAQGLTGAECKVVESLCAGRSMSEHAKSHFISPNTARTHLQRVREKVGVSRQADIVSKALS